MIPSLLFLLRSFSEWNERVFGSTLPYINLHITNAKSYEGLFRVKVIKRRGAVHYIPSITISTLYEKSKEDIEDVLLHEMIHFYIWHNKIKDTSKHGEVFRKMMADINRRFNRHLSISHKHTMDSAGKAIVNMWFPLMVVETADGRRLICVPAQSCLGSIYSYFRKSGTMKIRVYVSNDKRLSIYPRIRTPKLYNIDQGVLDEIIEKAYDASPSKNVK